MDDVGSASREHDTRADISNHVKNTLDSKTKRAESKLKRQEWKPTIQKKECESQGRTD
jgi:hypothetical protein